MFFLEQHVIVPANLAQFRRVMAKTITRNTKRAAGSRKKIGRPSRPSLLSELRDARGLTQEQVGHVLGIAGDAYGKIERGTTRLKADDAAKLADFYGVDIKLLLGNRSRRIPIRGYVGAGGEVYPIDDGGAARDVMCPIGLDPDQTVALEVRGNSMYPVINDGWIVFYTRDYPGVPTESLNQTCVVKVANDGPTLLKHLRLDRGAENRFTLVSFNAPQMDNIEVEWAAPILDWQSAKVARAQPIAA